MVTQLREHLLLVEVGCKNLWIEWFTISRQKSTQRFNPKLTEFVIYLRNMQIKINKILPATRRQYAMTRFPKLPMLL